MLAPSDVDLGVVKVRASVVTAALQAGVLGVEGVLDVGPVQAVVAGVLGQEDLAGDPVAVGALGPLDDDTLPVALWVSVS